MKKIILAVSGSVAVVKIEKLINLLKKYFEVKVIATDYVQKNFNTSKWNITQFNKDLNSFPEHIEIAKWADLIILAPASSNTLAKFASGITDNQVLEVLLAARTKILLAPAMNTYMYKALIQRKILEKLESWNCFTIGPNSGKLREGEIGLGRMSEPEEILEVAKNILLTPKNKKIIVSYGASKVFLDPLRYLTNTSSGKMGKLIIKQLKLKGFQVEGINIENYSNQEVLTFLQRKEFNTYVSVGAFADFDFENYSQRKIPKSTLKRINLKENIDVVSELRKTNKEVEIILFKQDNDKKKAIDKMQKVNAKFVFWNKVGSANNDLISGSFIFKNKEIPFEKENKVQLSKEICKFI